jgi:hypothetical protein
MHARIPRPAREWRNIAYQAIPRLVRARGGAVLWPEVEGLLAYRVGWLAEHAPDLGPANRLDPHILGAAKDLLVSAGVLQRDTATLQGRDVVAFIDSSAVADRRATEVLRLAARKRRLYRSFLGWTSDTKLCGGLAERHIAASLDDLRGKAIWLDPAIGSGQALTVDGVKITGGLDHAGHVALDPTNPGAGFVPFVIEDKNVRPTVYPHHIEVWDLLCKAALLPGRVPILVVPRIHYTTYILFRAIGALGIQTTQQWFAADPAISAVKFRKTVGDLALTGSVQLLHQDRPSNAITGFLTKTVHVRNEYHPDESLIQRSSRLWEQAAPICGQPQYLQLRGHDATNRRELYRQFLDDLHGEGFDVDDLLPRHIVHPNEEPDADEDTDWSEYIDDD